MKKTIYSCTHPFLHPIHSANSTKYTIIMINNHAKSDTKFYQYTKNTGIDTRMPKCQDDP